jgi:hypothetical protein
MKYTAKIVPLTILVSAAMSMATATTSVKPFLSFHSQGQDLARQMAATTSNANKSDMDQHYGSFTFTPEYTRSFNSDTITKELFGCWYLHSCNTLNIVGADAPGFDTSSLNANWFELAPDYVGSVCFEPVIQDFNADFDLFWAMDEWMQGVFLRIHTPLTWTKWDLGAKFTTTNAGTVAPIPNGHTTTYLDNVEKYFCKKETETSDDWVTESLNCSRFCGCLSDDNKTKTRLADIHIDLGWNILLEEDYHLGFFAHIVAPTGNKAEGEWLFEPIVGNGHHWELGGGLTGGASLWRNKEENKQLSFSLDAEVTHLFNSHQNRVFDLKNNPLSRYIQAVKNLGLAQETWSPLANLTSCRMDVSVPVQADVTAMFNFICHNWSYDLGYNFWVRSCEKLDCNSCDDCDCNNDCDACNNCCGQCVIKNDNAENWSIAHGATINNVDHVADIVLTNSMIDYEGARTKGMSHKVFGHIDYAWTDRDIVPFLGLGGFAEFGINDTCCKDDSTCNNCCSTTCNDNCSGCKYASLSQWGIWLTGGVTF